MEECSVSEFLSQCFPHVPQSDIESLFKENKDALEISDIIFHSYERDLDELFEAGELTPEQVSLIYDSLPNDKMAQKALALYSDYSADLEISLDQIIFFVNTNDPDTPTEFILAEMLRYSKANRPKKVIPKYKNKIETSTLFKPRAKNQAEVSSSFLDLVKKGDFTIRPSPNLPSRPCGIYFNFHFEDGDFTLSKPANISMMTYEEAKDLRLESFSLMERRKNIIRNACQSFNENHTMGRAKASFYSDQARDLYCDIQKVQNMAADNLLRVMNEPIYLKNEFSLIDLHELFAHEAISVTNAYLRFYFNHVSSSEIEPLVIITGSGSHSKKFSRLKPVIANLLQTQDWDYVPLQYNCGFRVYSKKKKRI